MATLLPVQHLISCTFHLDPKRQGGRRKAYTLIELLIVIGIIGILVAILIPSYIRHINNAKNTLAISDIHEMGTDIVDYMLDRGGLPESLADVGWENLLDPWGNPYKYKEIEYDDKMGKVKGKSRKDQFGDPINTDFDLYSMGKDEKSKDPIMDKDSLDDIIRAGNGGYTGLVSKWRHFLLGKEKKDKPDKK